MSIRLYVGNLPKTFENKELDSLFATVTEGVRFKAVFDRETGGCRGFGFANVADEKVANAIIEQLNGKEFGGNKLRVERSERKDSNGGGRRNSNNSGSNNGPQKRKETKKVVHSDAPQTEAPDPRWAGELAKLKDLLANQKTVV
tara:strand:- start:9870 stop:10301 length:432 start_codon:yes stop_codon:yes gene_type:complete